MVEPRIVRIQAKNSKFDVDVVEREWAVLPPMRVAEAVMKAAPDLLLGGRMLQYQAQFWQKCDPQL